MTRLPRGATAPATSNAGLATTWATVVLTIALAVAASAGAIPDSTQMSELRLAAAKAPVLLVRGDFGLRELRNPLLDSTGVRSASWEPAAHARPAIISTPDAPHTAMPAPIAWERISSLETQHQQKTKCTLMGGITGLALGMLMYGVSDNQAATGELSEADRWLLSMPPAGLAVGFVVGMMTGKRTIYPQPSQGNP
jgi:hypothetical protein